MDASDKKRKHFGEEARCIYVSESGDICVETKHSRRTFSPAEFVVPLRKIAMKKRFLPVVQTTGERKRIFNLIFGLACFLFFAACAAQPTPETLANSERVVAVGGSVTEIVYALDAGETLVATDTSSVFPEAATKLPQVGYQRQLSAEGVLSLKPSLVMILPEAGPPAAIQQLENAGIRILRVNNESTIEGTKAKIRQIAEVLNRRQKGEEIIEKLENDLAEAERTVAAQTAKPKVVFIYSRGAGSAQVSGTGTPADAMIKMAGGTNAVTEFSEYKPLTPESLVAAQPDVILLPARSLASIGGFEGVLNLPGVAETPAGKNKRIVAIDDTLLLGFTPRLGLGIRELCEKIH